MILNENKTLSAKVNHTQLELRGTGMSEQLGWWLRWCTGWGLVAETHRPCPTTSHLGQSKTGLIRTSCAEWGSAWNWETTGMCAPNGCSHLCVWLAHLNRKGCCSPGRRVRLKKEPHCGKNRECFHGHWAHCGGSVNTNNQQWWPSLLLSVSCF